LAERRKLFVQCVPTSLRWSPRAGVAANSNSIEVFWNNLSLGIITGNGNNGSSWLGHVYDVQADANGFGVLKFSATGISDSVGGSLDKISVTTVPSRHRLPSLVLVLVVSLHPTNASRSKDSGFSRFSVSH